jgi:hypothetical protein
MMYARLSLRLHVLREHSNYADCFKTSLLQKLDVGAHLAARNPNLRSLVPLSRMLRFSYNRFLILARTLGKTDFS